MIEIGDCKITKSQYKKYKLVPWKISKGFIVRYEPSNFKLETTSMWDYPIRGDWASHTPTYPGNIAPQVIRNILELYSKEFDLVMDPMVGGGTTPVECKLMNRNSISVDINPKAIFQTIDRLHFNCERYKNTTHHLFLGNANNLNLIRNDTVDLIIMHPPYADMIEYSENIMGDLSKIHNYDLFFKEYAKIVDELLRVLKPNHYCAVIMGDTHKNGYYVPLSYRLMVEHLKKGFVLKEDIIKKEHNCKSICNTYPSSFLQTMHEHIFIFKKLKTEGGAVPIGTNLILKSM